MQIMCYIKVDMMICRNIIFYFIVLQGVFFLEVDSTFPNREGLTNNKMFGEYFIMCQSVKMDGQHI